MKIIIHGILGRMGRTVLAAAEADPEFSVVCGFDAAAGTGDAPAAESAAGAPLALPFRGAEIPVYADFADADADAVADAVIDFSHYTAVPPLLAWTAERGLPTVVCTTALGEPEREALRNAARTIPVFNSSNMSLGVAVVKKLVRLAAPALEKDFNVEIIEAHHNRKKDSPSGTAILLADAVSEACSVPKDYVFGRHGKSDEVKISDLGIHSVRGGTIPGTHTVLFAGPDELIEIKHTAYSRSIFAQGALRAAAFVASGQPGLYSMDDML
jgi:4-hydroxy-tetrahydrodipicolinate reductase